MSRPERFPATKDSAFIQKIETFIGMTIAHIFSKYKESPLETKNANFALSQFIKVWRLLALGHQDVVTVSLGSKYARRVGQRTAFLLVDQHAM